MVQNALDDLPRPGSLNEFLLRQRLQQLAGLRQTPIAAPGEKLPGLWKIRLLWPRGEQDSPSSSLVTLAVLVEEQSFGTLASRLARR